MSRLLYYGLLIPFSLLPFRFLYWVSDLLYILLYRVFSYRHEVVSSNLQMAFPEMTDSQRARILEEFYRHICDIIVEGIKSFTISNEELGRRYNFVNPEVLDSLYRERRDVIIAAGHYANWEWATMQSSRVFKHVCVGIYTPLTNKFLEQKMAESRSRTGLVLVPKDQVKEYFKKEHQEPQLYYFLIDQSPSNANRAYWSTFLGKETGIQYGAEKYSKEFNIPVFFLKVDRVKRGYYIQTLEEVVMEPTQQVYGQILEKIYQKLESEILQQPAWWLWSHRRWKHSKP